jgi:hypothetical protein
MLVGVTSQVSTARGCLLGLVLGDAMGAAAPAAGTAASQLACFTVEGVIRAHVRGSHKGICHPPSVVWHAYQRWAAMQRIAGIERMADEDWPDGWLAQVPALAARRGSAPATVAALRGHRMGTSENPAGGSTGAHALTRSLPVGLLALWGTEPGGFAAEVAATTHGGDAVTAAAIGAAVVAALAEGRSLAEAAEQAPSAADAAQSAPRQKSVLGGLAPDTRAMSALAGGVYVALSFPEPERLGEALAFATAGGAHVAAVTGALLGTAHGVDALPVDRVSRLELAWVADVLARDLASEFVDHPSGGAYAPASDPGWWHRYPGW